MKKLFALVALAVGFATGSLLAADFTGTLQWSIKVDVTDPQLKKQLDAQSGPEAQAQLQAAREAMNSPEMQEMMKANPQMREMMEKQLKAMSKPGGLFPKSSTLHIKGRRSLMRTEGGPAAGDLLSWADKDVSYQIDREARTYRKLDNEAVKESLDDKFKVTPTKETAKILGYACKRYLVETSEGGAPMQWTLWATEDIKGLDAGALRNLRLGQSSGPDLFGKIDGVPLKIEISHPQMTMVMTATSVKEEALPDSLFQLPAGFKEVSAR